MSVTVARELPSDVRARVDRVLDRVSGGVGRSREVTPLEGGLTNVNLRVETDDRALVVRLFSEGGELLAIDRDAEHENSRRAAESGAAPGVVGYLPNEQALVIEWVEGRTFEAQDLQVEDNLARVADVCRTLHSSQRFVSDFDMFAVQRRYLDLVRDRGYRLPDRYLDFAPQVDRVAVALAVRADPTVPCNNDLLAANFIDAGERLWVIDFEYAGNNDACFELGNIWAESKLSPELLEVLVGAYYRRPLRHKVARARLFGLMSNYGWTLWASIQDAVSDIDFDFWSWGMEKYDRAVAELDGPAFEQLLNEATHPD
ncbi:MAG: phosphotransferase family protein [Actinomycetota bacterium]|nr:phosphotransferase family protein [Actinomycetota bacterium]